MIVYIPQRIESAEQAEALPVGIVAIRLDDDGHVRTASRRCRCQDPECDAWFSTDWNAPHDHAGVVGADALVPVEAEEQTITVQTRGQARPDWRTRLTTPWKWIDGPSPDHSLNGREAHE